jgi:hypothetical protein
MEKKYPEHPVYKWSTERLDNAVAKFRKVFIHELRHLILAEYGLVDTLLDTGIIDLNAWEATTNKDYPVVSLRFRDEPILGPDYCQFQLFRLLRISYGIGSHPVITNLEECKRENKSAIIFGVGVVTNDGTSSIGPVNMDVIWMNVETLRLHKSDGITKAQAMVMLAEAVKTGKGTKGK